MKARRALTAAVTALTALLALSLCAAVLILYADGLRRRAEAGSGLIPVFTRENVGRTLLWIAPVFALWVAAVVAAAVTRSRPQGSLPAPKRLPAMTHERERKDLALFALRMALLSAAIVLAFYGIHSGGLREVLAKAVNICTECIGLG